ncbi:hypothetical protein FPSE_04321 [Fusarium pseudograminearum CS3096]|uniref:Uncharacterized protein n=1 Tax=Fusarium pseudograminearum (strain CS3096) TaxID=1028729 RepID=K3UST4_FUSPC|nr:hypothetical protein FPSE_04321 [Fusarium pseudograminearum CS3096]EKJ75546.1 hypothetical protein FPSE_04321 [Fusarium pseudograminearum CS3096]
MSTGYPTRYSRATLVTKFLTSTPQRIDQQFLGNKAGRVSKSGDPKTKTLSIHHRDRICEAGACFRLTLSCRHVSQSTPSVKPKTRVLVGKPRQRQIDAGSWACCPRSSGFGAQPELHAYHETD